MMVWGVTEDDIRAAVSEARLTVWNEWTTSDGRLINGIGQKGKALTVRLGVDRLQPRDEVGLLPYQKRGRGQLRWIDGRLVEIGHGRRLPYVTWEGHREFMRILFRDHPEARIKTAIADYRGRKDFWAKHPETRGAFEGRPIHY